MGSRPAVYDGFRCKRPWVVEPEPRRIEDWLAPKTEFDIRSKAPDVGMTMEMSAASYSEQRLAKFSSELAAVAQTRTLQLQVEASSVEASTVVSSTATLGGSPG